MRFLISICILICMFSCQKEAVVRHEYSQVTIQLLHKDTLGVRALEIINDTLAGFGHATGYGFINLKNDQVNIIRFDEKDTLNHKNWIAQQRAVASSSSSFFSLGIGNPARLRKIDINTLQERLVYEEEHSKIFYDAMQFWNKKEGIAMGDPTEDCLSILITRDGGETWNKVSCNDLPKTKEGEAAFAASNGNISVVGNHTWVVSGGIQSRVFYSPNKGKTWEVYDTPIIQGKSTTGIYSCDFYDTKLGVIYGGDYTKPEDHTANKAMTRDGGKTWSLLNGVDSPGYKSCVRFVPKSGGQELIAVGFTGIHISNDQGKSWKKISDSSFYTIRFIDDQTAIAAGKYSIAKLSF